jgi:serine/threonine protein phosphatase PrpC
MKFSVFQISRKGGRANNQDRMGYCYSREAALFAVADGMGGHPEGQVAAQIALQAVSALFQQRAVGGFGDIQVFLKDALTQAHREILAYTVAKNMPDGPRTTLVMALILGDTVAWIHCGDSRLYFSRDDLMVERTIDHSYAEQPELMRNNVDRFVNRNVLFTCIGSQVEPIYSLSDPIKLKEGDRFLLCTDGLWSTLADDEIVYEMTRQSVSQSAPELTEKALRRGGPTCDNVTVIAVAWEESIDAGAKMTAIMTDSLGDEVYASTISDFSGDDYGPLTADSIQTSVASIKNAIQKSASDRH